ncbi:condensation domain-containing protein, partial [Cesiribacter sp. SM1]|uniref:condensation domain-containing protein n=1 Tax=Cesiribacter sp. SM1 TaxID=2861196 RepID=UPI001CD4D459
MNNTFIEVISILNTAKKEGISIFMDGDKLKFKVEKNKALDKLFIEKIREHKLAIIEFLSSDEGNVRKIDVQYKKIKSFNREDYKTIPLSFSQERLWFIDQLQGSSHYHLPAVFRLQGALDVEGLQASFRQILERHESLRTVFLQEEGEACQQIMDAAHWQMGYSEAPAQDGASLRALVAGAAVQPFDLSKDYMLRVELIRLSAQEHLLVVVQHHIASDGWSISVLVGELTELYKARQENREPALLPLPIQYADYALWQREYLQGEVLEEQRQYWKQQLSGVEALQLPTDYVRPPEQSTRGGRLSFSLDKELSLKLEQFSNQQGATLFMSLLSAFKVLLYRYSGQEDICVGSPIAGRLQPEVEPLIGFFVNTLALRSDLSGNKSFKELVEQVKETTLEAYKHQDLPFEKVVEAVGVARDRSRTPLFQVVFTLDNMPEMSQVQLGDLTLTAENLENATTKFDLILSVSKHATGMRLNVEYCTDLFAEATVVRMMEHYQRLLSQLIEDPAIKIDELPLLNDQEEKQLTEGYNNTAAAYPQDKTLVELFSAQAAKTPDAVAVADAAASLTYQELDERSNQLAHYLQSRGVTAETLVPLCLDRSLELVVAQLGVLKAGGAYVPIDPSYPRQRIHYMLQDTAAHLVLSASAYEELLETETASG